MISVGKDTSAGETQGAALRWMRVEDVGDVQLGRQRSPKNRSAKYPTKYLRAANITEQGLDLGDVLEMDFKPEERDRYQLHAGDIVLSEASGSASQVGKPALWTGELPLCCFQNTVIRLRPRHADPKYLLWVFTHFYRNGIFARVAAGVGINHLSAAKFKQLEIPIPPLADQRRIVAEIENQFTRLDAGVAALRRTQANLKRYRAAVLKAACEGRLVPTEAELARKKPCVTDSIPTNGFDSLSHGPNPRTSKRVAIPQPLHGAQAAVSSSLTSSTKNDRGSTPYRCAKADFETGAMLLERILIERRQNWNGRGAYNEPATPDVTNLPVLPEGWVWCMSDAVFSFITSGSRGWANHYSETGALFLRVGNLDHENIRLDLAEVQRVSPPKGAEGTRTAVQPNDILISITADVGMVGLVPERLGEAYINQHIALARPLPSLCPSYIAYYLCASEGGWGRFKKLQRGATKVGLGLDDIRAVPIPLPPLAEQTRIAAEIERRVSVVEELEAVVSANLQRATRLRQSILQRTFRAT